MVNERRIRKIRKMYETKSTDDLLKIWTENDRYVYFDETFIAVKQLLTERGIPVPPQNQPTGHNTNEEKEPSLMSVTPIIASIAGIILLTIGLLINPGVSEELVNFHKLHIKQTLYYFSGICFIITAIIYGFDKMIASFKDEKEDRD